jgi:hypothetical protein
LTKDNEDKKTETTLNKSNVEGRVSTFYFDRYQGFHKMAEGAKVVANNEEEARKLAATLFKGVFNFKLRKKETER